MPEKRRTRGGRDSDIGPTDDEQMVDALIGLAGGKTPPDLIHDAERAGQAAVVEAPVLPARGWTLDAAGRPLPDDMVFAPAGVEILGQHDDLFLDVRLPAGWRKVARPDKHDRAYYSDLVDARGRVRATIFYKAVSYDRKAHLIWETRFRPTVPFEADDPDDRNVRWVVEDAATGTRAWESEPFVLEDYERHRAARAECDAWLEAHRPEWNDPGAYWDEEAPA